MSSFEILKKRNHKSFVLLFYLLLLTRTTWQFSEEFFFNYRGEVMNGGFGLVLDGTAEAAFKADSMLNWDVSNGVARRYVNGLLSFFSNFMI